MRIRIADPDGMPCVTPSPRCQHQQGQGKWYVSPENHVINNRTQKCDKRIIQMVECSAISELSYIVGIQNLYNCIIYRTVSYGFLLTDQNIFHLQLESTVLVLRSEGNPYKTVLSIPAVQLTLSIDYAVNNLKINTCIQELIIWILVG